ncbi:chalcone isomerase-like protein [Volucribacter psittacicida]|uniref:Chalcone isomerase-like protein n=1 Tax=Volucribacter psittacicida TaxID=203482 RepID=A0A4R1G1I2_9PAST|nr:chalcone isomerase family protein [Volucribacter psittacicida]TCK01484.1 chalcone isomerase-like protein [Volucribacter psittacicida]
MKLKSLLFLFCYGLPSLLFAQWKMVGKADYTWGPFHVYTIALYTETGEYKAGIRPLMLTIKFNKPVEGKSFAITLMKEMNSLNIEGFNKHKVLEDLQAIFPDLQPNDQLSYIAMEDQGYFVLNDTVLNHNFDAAFSDAVIAIWLAENSNFSRLQNALLGNKDKTQTEKLPHNTPEIAPTNQENLDPKLDLEATTPLS